MSQAQRHQAHTRLRSAFFTLVEPSSPRLLPEHGVAPHRTRLCLRIRALVTLFVAVMLLSPARAQQASPSTSKPVPQPTASIDEFQRDTPRSSVAGFLKACRDGDYERAAAYLDLGRLKPNERAKRGPVLARHLKVVIDHTLWIDLDSLSDSPDGNGTATGALRRVRVGNVRTPKGPVSILLERQPVDDIQVWRISAATVGNIPALYSLFGYGHIGEWLPDPFFEITFLQIELWQWIALTIWAVLVALTAWLISSLVARLARPLVARWRKTAEDAVEQLIVGPLRLGVGILLFISSSLTLGLALPVRAFFNGAGKALVVAALTWFLLRLIDIVFLKAADHMVARGQGAAVAMLPLGRRAAKVFLIVVAALAFLQNVGFDVSGLLAGLGVGGLAVALAAQETVKNFFGGVTLIADQPVRVGDLCRFGDKTGTVEDISLWSTRVRTPDRTVISIPNAQFASLQLENFARRDRIRLATSIGLHTDTSADQIRRVLAQTTELLQQHPQVDPASARAQLAGIGNTAFRIEMSAYILTADFQQYTTIREELFLRIMDVVAASGAKFAALG